MFWQFTLCLAFLGACSVNADSHDACATPAKVTAVNNLVGLITTGLAPIMMDQTKTDDQKFSDVLQGVCTSATSGGVREHVDSIEVELAGCSALLEKTAVMTLNFSAAFSFEDLFADFTSVENFCGCVPNLKQAMVMNTVKDQLMYTMTGAQYPAIKLSVLCGTPAVKTAVATVAAQHKGSCTKVYKYADILNDQDNVIIMNNFANLVCDAFNDTKFMCAMQGSATNAFKNCINGVTGDNNLKCERNKCVDENIDASCGDGRLWYKWAVNMQKTTPNIFEIDNDCGNGVTSVIASSGLLLVALFTMLFF